MTEQNTVTALELFQLRTWTEFPPTPTPVPPASSSSASSSFLLFCFVLCVCVFFSRKTFFSALHKVS